MLYHSIGVRFRWDLVQRSINATQCTCDQNSTGGHNQMNSKVALAETVEVRSEAALVII